jgi:hypothetical protein
VIRLPKDINLKGITERRRHMAQEGKSGNGRAAGASVGIFWFMGWLFTIAFANLVWWKIILGIVVWPYFLGLEIR